MDSPIIKVDDKYVPLFRIVWIADVPHFCGEDDCMHEGDYEIRLDVDDSLWTNSLERDEVLERFAVGAPIREITKRVARMEIGPSALNEN